MKADRKPKRRPVNNRTDSVSARDEGGRPEVIVEFLFDQGLLFISVNNIGARPALKVSVKFNKKFFGLGGKKEFSALPLFKNIEFLGPKREIVTLLDNSSSYFATKQPTKISARVSYSDPEEQKYETTINYDLEIYRELVYLAQACSESERS